MLLSGTSQQKATLFLLGAALFLLILVIVLVFSSQGGKQNFPTTPSPTPIQIDGTPRTQKIAPTQRTFIERTTLEEVEQLPTIENKVILPEGGTRYTLTSPLVTRKNEIIVQNNQAVFERILVPENRQDPGFVTLTEYKNEYGQPQETIRGSYFYGNLIETFIYADKGFALIGNPFTNEVYEIQTFAPTTVENYKARYGDDINEDAEAGHQ